MKKIFAVVGLFVLMTATSAQTLSNGCRNLVKQSMDAFNSIALAAEKHERDSLNVALGGFFRLRHNILQECPGEIAGIIEKPQRNGLPGNCDETIS